MQSNFQPYDDRRRLALGMVLLIVGAIALVEQAIQFEVPDAAWPFAVIVPGITLLVVGLIVRHEAGVGLTVAGSIVTTVGLVLLYQDATDRWESWAYAWALVGPTASGVGLALSGLVGGDRLLVRRGTDLALLGLTMFAIGWVILEGILGISGDGTMNEAAGPVILIMIGAFVVLRGLVFRRSTDVRGPTSPPAAPAA